MQHKPEKANHSLKFLVSVQELSTKRLTISLNISRPEFVQDVAFGTKTLKLDSGEKIIIPAVIRIVIPSRIIRQYLDYCKENTSSSQQASVLSTE